MVGFYLDACLALALPWHKHDINIVAGRPYFFFDKNHKIIRRSIRGASLSGHARRGGPSGAKGRYMAKIDPSEVPHLRRHRQMAALGTTKHDVQHLSTVFLPLLKYIIM